MMLSMNRKPKTLGQLLGRAVLRSVLFVCALASGFMVVSMNQGGGSATAPVERPVAQGSPLQLVEKHDCWTGEAPKDMQGQVPGHVVVSKGSAPVYGGSKLVGQALEQIFDGVDHGLTVHAFCR